MKPLRLEFKGINSFSEHTIIDFETLTKTGIFGIFGDTGSGKSTILDCINFALYGDVKRSEVKTDIINYRCNAAEVKFVFNIINEGRRKIYTVERILKNDKSGTHKAMLFERDGETEVCIADKTSTVEKKIIEILGVGDEDFRKCIALPQGEFAQFVKSTPSARLALIERLFSLSKYGDRLKEKLFTLQRATEDEYQNLSGRLGAYEGVSQDSFNELKKRAEKEKKQLDKLTAESKKAAESYKKFNLLNEKRAELEKTVKLIEQLNSEKERIEELRKGLKLLPACREVVKLNEELTQKLSEVQKLSENIEKTAKLSENLALVIKNIEEKIKKENFDERIAECLARAASFKTCEGKNDKLKLLLSQLKAKRAEYKRKEDGLNKLLADRILAEKAVASAEKQLNDCVGTDLKQIFDVQFKGAVLREEYAKQLGWFLEFEAKIEGLEDGSPLYKFASEEIKNKIAEYRKRVCDVKDFSLDAVQEALDNYLASGKERERFQKNLSGKREELQKLDSLIELCRSELKTIERDGANLRVQADELENELKQVFGENCDDYSFAAIENETLLNKLKIQKQRVSEELEETKNYKNSYELTLEKTKTLKVSADAEIEKLKRNLFTIIEENDFKSVENCIKTVEEFAAEPDAEQKLKDFDGRLLTLNARRAELEKTQGIAEVSEETVVSAKCECDRLDGEIKTLTGEIAVLNADISACEKRLVEKKLLEKDFMTINAQRELIAKLKELTKNNKFMEFIANEYLCDISSLASSTLLKLTDGRYFLSYQNNGFSVGDNFNCGNLRGVNTLSGGETFLVSLSLALALSQTICARSMKSIEFFFLDEGFGTLDTTLVDTVMNALEKLKSSDFTIGVISHVEELKHRIDSKITVNKATESHGSTVEISS